MNYSSISVRSFLRANLKFLINLRALRALRGLLSYRLWVPICIPGGDMAADWMASLARFWRGLVPAVRIGLYAYGAIVVILAIVIGVRHTRHVEVKQAAVSAPVLPATIAPVPIKIVIDSIDKATLADAFSDDSSTSVSMNTKTSER